MGTPIPINYVIIEVTVGSRFEKHISFPQKEGTARRNITIVSVALGLGYGLGATNGILAHLPQGIQLIFGGSGIVPAALVAIVLNIVLPKSE